MYRGPSKYFKVVRHQDLTYAVWHADAPPWPRWQETGHYGSENDCWDYIDDNEQSTGFLFLFPNDN